MQITPRGSGDFQRTFAFWKGILLRGRGSYSLDHGPSWIFFAPEGLEGSGHDLRSHAHRFIHPVLRDQGTALDGRILAPLWQDSQCRAI